MSETRLPEVLEVLRMGWVKGNYRSPQGHCLVGAICRVWRDSDGVTLVDHDGYEQDYNTVLAVVREQHGLYGIADFNDSRESTFTDIERVVEKAILRRQEEL